MTGFEPHTWVVGSNRCSTNLATTIALIIVMMFVVPFVVDENDFLRSLSMANCCSKTENNFHLIADINQIGLMRRRRVQRSVWPDWDIFERSFLIKAAELLWNGGRHSSVVSSLPTILCTRFRIPCTPTMLFSIWVIDVGMRKGRKTARLRDFS